MAVPADASSPPSIQFVMFYAFRRRDPDTEAQIALLARSIRLSYPEARIVLLTNGLGAQAELPSYVAIRPGSYESRNVMVERLRAYRDHAQAASPGSFMICMDTDMLVLRRFDELLSGDADVTVTVRRDGTWPINAGLVIARFDEGDRVRGFFDALLRFCEGLPDEQKLWYGDQVSLAAILRPTPGRFRDAYREERGGLQVRFAPSRLYNQTPRPWMLRVGLYRGAARILHFKGGRKERMAFYSRLYLSGFFRGYVARRYGG